MSGRIEAPWTGAQVVALSHHQLSGEVHPYTCGSDHESDGEKVLVPTREGWMCPDEACGYVQTWAHDPLPDEPVRTVVVEIDPNVRVGPGQLTFSGLEDCSGPVEEGQVVTVIERESGLVGGGLIVAVDRQLLLVYLSVAWGTLTTAYRTHLPEEGKS